MATVYATIAADGKYTETHFVEAVYDRDGNEVQPIDELDSEQALDSGIAQDLQFVGSGIDGTGEPLGRPYTGKTGTWEAGDDYPEEANAHTWYTGAIPQLSIAAWVGNATAESAPLLNEDGGYDNVYGSTLSYPVWRQFMDQAIEVKGYESQDWKPVQRVGSPIVDDILNEDGTIDADSPYCAAFPTDTKCKREQPPGGNNAECDPISEAFGLCTPGTGGNNGNGRGDDD
jgi:membrane peptidoglycan carboxypeptidase